jgi:septum formation protein
MSESSSDTMWPRRLILASGSPRRRDLLREAGYEIFVAPADVDEENVPTGMLPSELARHLALSKARAVAPRFPDDYVLGADTVVAFGDTAMSKPADEADARRMLTLLAGTTHVVITGVALVCEALNVERVVHVMSAVRMRSLSPREVEEYLRTGEWRGKAGAYGIQDRDPFVTNMAGSLSNVVGLPMEAVREMLEGAGILPEPPPPAG